MAGLEVTVDTTGLDAFIKGMKPAVEAATLRVANDIATDWAADVLARETADDKPEGRPDYDENIVVDDSDPEQVRVYTDIPWASQVEYGSPDGTIPARPSMQLAVERHRDDLPAAIAEALGSL